MLNLHLEFINQIVELFDQPEKLEDMGKNSLIASGYAQQRADEASLYLLDLLKRNPDQSIISK